MQPIFRIVGTKTGRSLADARNVLLTLLQNDLRLVEPFCGSASVSLSVNPQKCLLSDLQPNSILTLQILRDKPFSLLKAFDRLREMFLLCPESRAFYEIRDNPPNTAVERAAWFLFITHAAFNWLWRVNRKGRCNTTFGGDAGIRRVTNALERENALLVSEWLNSGKREIRFADAFSVISECGEGDLLYVDPPYINQFDAYTSESFKEAEHIRLSEELYFAWKRGAQVVLHCNADKDLASRYSRFCGVFLREIRRMVAGSHRAGTGNNAWEMFAISGPKQLSFDFFKGTEHDNDNEKSEETTWDGGMIQPVWNEQEKRWETWTPNLS